MADRLIRSEQFRERRLRSLDAGAPQNGPDDESRQHRRDPASDSRHRRLPGYFDWRR
jgi:hypothetical protein